MKKSFDPLYLYVAAVILGGVVVSARAAGAMSSWDHFTVAEFWILAAGVVAGEFIRIRIPRGRETLMVTIGDPFALALLFTFGLGPALVAKLVATILDDIRRRQQWWKALFNLGQFSLSIAVAHSVVTSLGEFPVQGANLAGTTVAIALLGTLVYFVFNTSVVNTAIAMSIGQSPYEVIRDTLKSRALHQAMLIGFTPVVMAAMDNSLWLFPLLLVPIFVVYHSGTMLQKQMALAEQLRELHEATRTNQRVVSSQDWVQDVLTRVCTMFNATSAVITLLPNEQQPEPLKTKLDMEKGTFQPWKATDLDPTEGVWARVASEDKALLLASPIDVPRLRAHYEEKGIKDVMAAPLHSDDAVLGVIAVFNREGDTTTFSSDDLKLFETLSNHVSIALENNRLIEELEESLAHLTEMNRLKDDFVASVSHELRTPLTSIQGFVKTLLRTDANFSPEDQRSFLETVDRQSSRLHRLIEDLLAVSRIESRTDAAQFTTVSLGELARDVVEEVHNRITEGQITLDFEEDLTVETDGGKVHQILANLVDNGLKYGGKDQPVTVRARRDGEGVSVSVIDQGSGVPPELQEKVFDRFYQVDQSATRAVGGAGLGLYICRRMAEAIGGRIWLEKTGPEGSVFTVWVPFSNQELVAPNVMAVEQQDGAWKL